MAVDRGPFAPPTIINLLPNARYSVEGEAPSPDPPTELAVVGTVVEVVPGAAMDDGESHPERAYQVQWDSERADWKTVHLHIDVEEEIAGEAPADLVVGLSTSPDVDVADMARQLRGLGRVVLLLRDGGAVFDYDDSLYAIPLDGGRGGTPGGRGRGAVPRPRTSEVSRDRRPRRRLNDSGRVPGRARRLRCGRRALERTIEQLVRASEARGRSERRAGWWATTRTHGTAGQM